MWRLLYKSLTQGIATPSQYEAPPDGFRGLPELDVSRCDGCGACAMACPTLAIRLVDEADRSLLSIDASRCLFCDRCAEVCEPKALTMSKTFELAGRRHSDMVDSYSIPRRES